MTTGALAFLAAFSCVFVSVLVLRPVARNVGLVDIPCHRKQHVGEIPLVGGLAIYTAICICSFVVTPFDIHYKIFLLSSAFMVLIGALDDFHDLDAKLRLVAQFLIGALMVFGADLYIENLGPIFSTTNIQLGVGGQIFTVLAVVTCINAFNMADGVDGLVATLSLNTFAAIGIMATFEGLSFDTNVTSMLAGAVLAFLFFNMGWFKKGRYKIFMGDAGSMLMGLTVIWLLTYATQGEGHIMSPITAVWFIAIPLMDMFSVMFRRILAGQSPLKASRDHLHHILLFNGFRSRQVTVIIATLALLGSAAGIAAESFGLSDSLMALLFVALFGAYNTAMLKQDKAMNNRVAPQHSLL